MLVHPPSADSPETVAVRRLQGTVWRGFSLAQTVYAALVRFGAWLGSLGVSANGLTIASLILAGGGAVLVSIGRFWTAVALLLVSGALDALDGAVARATHTETRFGALLDSTSDRASDALPLMGAAVFLSLQGHGTWTLAPLAALVTSFIISYVRARAEGLGMKLPPLFMRRAERWVLSLVLLVTAGALTNPADAASVLGFGFAFLAALQGVGAIAILVAAYRHEHESGSSRESG